MFGVNLMAKATVHGTPEQCTQAVLDEVEGRSSWWHPHLLLRHRPATPHDGVGLVVDAIGSPRGRPERIRGTTRWAMRLDGYTPGREMRWTYLGGHYRGWAIWEFAGLGEGLTRIGVVGEIHPAGWNRLRALVVDDVFEQMRILEHGFVGLDRHLGTLATVAPPMDPFEDDPPVEGPDDDPDFLPEPDDTDPWEEPYDDEYLVAGWKVERRAR